MDETTDPFKPTSARPQLMSSVLWRWLVPATLLAAISAAFLFPELLEDSEKLGWRANNGDLFERSQEDRWQEAGLKSSISAGVWRTSAASAKRVYMLVEPGNDADTDEWYFKLDGARIFCMPTTTESGWLFTDCQVHGSLTGFEARVSREPRYLVEATLDHAGRVSSLVMIKYGDLTEPGPRELYRVWGP